MTRDPRYDILFEPVKIGPVTARNRFYQVPHCNGMGRTFPSSMAAMRGVKAEGGWAVVSTEQIDIHPTSDITGATEGRMWSDQDVPYLARMCDAVHEHDSLALIELTHNGKFASNSYSREVPIFPSHMPVVGNNPVQARAMDKADIRDYRRWHLEAVKRSKQAGFDIVCCYAAHNLSLAGQFMLPRYNQRTDEYGGSLENRVRLFREIMEDAKEAVGDTMGVVARFAVDELRGAEGMEWEKEGREIIEMLAELPDLWDVNVAEWHNDSVTSRFAEEGFQEPFIAFVKSVTTKPVVAVGRYTTPDRMVSLIKNGVMDMIGAARPSIADPFLPKKIEEGRIEDIRECIGCNICVGWDALMAPMRCTQNPTKGEEWRKGWHPERIPEKTADESVLIIGAGPAGLEAARAAGERGYNVTLAEADEELGGRVAREARLPGLSAWGRVRDYRVYQIQQMANVEVFPASRLTAEQVLEFGADHIAIATGSHWRKDGYGRIHQFPIPGLSDAQVLTPDDVMAGVVPAGPVIVYDDDHYYMGGIVAEKLRGDGLDVTLVTSDPVVSSWTSINLEQHRIQAHVLGLGIEVLANHKLHRVAGQAVELACVFSERVTTLEAASIVMVTSRLPDAALFDELDADQARLKEAGSPSLRRIGDCYGPATIAAAVYEGHRFARELGTEPEDIPYKRELTELADEFALP
ncbi:MAG: FAD-dependent oxidoreductase [Alphaproteobacteria bacterium]|nr:FAD-dependent oxidoreductase [Rhodospirillaceae bacterium]MBT6508893.1 FAD-dependent oxidoreductase [Rhodospirillaceae bacterium]MBT7615071.1 FAD-dependent oxidoreductase [Rhodospirillaceae bacterium]MBT7648483.1 FAD-dependent oxidoreductase [Rhodospirillaceae bacterium]MDG2480792.1 FAD-dependent oxidoreductase [Alphaproteobacteria bacterium]